MKTKLLNNIFTALTLLLLSGNTLRAGVTTTYFIQDALGSPVATMDESGNTLWKKQYHPYGREHDADPASFSNRVSFTGHAYDRELELDYMGARYYDPIIGRFMGVDSIEIDPNDPRTFNRYAYANNNPYRYMDPDGRLPILVPILITAGLEALNLGFEAHDNINNPCGDCVRSSSFGIPGPVAGKGAITTGKILATKSVENAVVRISRGGDKAVRITRSDGTIIDISSKRVKEFVPNTHAKAPPGALQRVKFDNAIPGSKGFKRTPTKQELGILKNTK